MLSFVWEWAVKRAFLILVVVGAFAFSLLLGVSIDTRNETRNVAKAALALAKKNRELATEIQRERRENIRRSCEDQNQRHTDLTIFLLDQGYTKDENPVLYLFIDKLAPYRDCTELVKLLAGAR